MTPADDVRHDEFLRLFTEHTPAVRAFVRSLVPTLSDANDVMQEVAVVLWGKFGDYGSGEDFRRWAFGVAKMKVLAWQRDRGRDRHVFGLDVNELLATHAEQHTERLAAQRDALQRCLEKLPAEQRQLVDAAYAPGVRIPTRRRSRFKDRSETSRGHSGNSNRGGRRARWCPICFRIWPDSRMTSALFIR